MIIFLKETENSHFVLKKKNKKKEISGEENVIFPQ